MSLGLLGMKQKCYPLCYAPPLPPMNFKDLKISLEKIFTGARFEPTTCNSSWVRFPVWTNLKVCLSHDIFEQFTLTCIAKLKYLTQMLEIPDENKSK